MALLSFDNDNDIQQSKTTREPAVQRRDVVMLCSAAFVD